MTHRRLLRPLLAVLAVGAVHFSCRPASYEFIKPKKNHSADGQGDPTNVTPPPNPNDSGARPPALANVPPTARIEVIWDGKSVTKVRAGRPVTVRPTADTVDPDDLGKSQCANPGIVKAAYDLGGEASPEAARSLGCESLGVPYTFPTPGEYRLEMTVTSNENETAFAAMTLLVVDENAPLTEDGGFTIQAVPLLTQVGKDVAFFGFCKTSKAYKIDWTFGDQAKGAGAETKHAYRATGQYRVDAECTETATGGNKWDASLTVVVLDQAVVIPGGPTGPTKPDDGEQGGDDVGDDSGNGDGTDDSGTDDGTDSGEPGQNPGQKKPPTQNKPGQKLPW